MASSVAPGVAARTGSGERSRLLTRVDVALVVATTAIGAIGAVAVYSVTRVRHDLTGPHPQLFLDHQLVWLTIGAAALVIAAAIDYRRLLELAPVLYGGVVVGLVAVMSPLGSSAKGSQRWFSLGPLQLQPSAFATLAVVLMLAWYCDRRRGEAFGPHDVLAMLAVAGVPMALVAVQPDLGTALVIGVITIAVLTVAGIRPAHMLILVVVAVVGVVAVVQLGVLKSYQVHRLTAFVNQGGDVQRTTYNLDQSKTTIGSGGFFGRGLFKGPQTNLAYVPEQQTDFIFTAVGEQLGFAGSATLLLLFGIVVWRTWAAAHAARDLAGRLLCAGVVAFLAFEVFENVGMTMGIMPITGIPLPLVSYGGSATIATLTVLGLVLNVRARRFH